MRNVVHNAEDTSLTNHIDDLIVTEPTQNITESISSQNDLRGAERDKGGTNNNFAESLWNFFLVSIVGKKIRILFGQT